MRSLRTNTHINASPTNVFRVLADFRSYADWNPWLRAVAGITEEVKVGDVITVKLRVTGLFGIRLAYRVERLRSPDTLLLREVSWFEFLLGIQREYQVLTRSGGSAIFSAGLRINGPLAPVVKFLGSKYVRRALKKEAAALKKYCEAHYPLSGTAAGSGSEA